jgi:hypothetical protein
MKPMRGPDPRVQKTTSSHQLGGRVVSHCFSFLVRKIFNKHVWLVYLVLELPSLHRR